MNLSPLPIQKFFDDNGRPLVGGLLYTYEAGTTTKVATYSDEAGTPNTNPVVLDYRGECDVWLDPEVTYKFVLAPAGDTDPPTRSIWTVDNIAAGITYAELTRQLLGRILWPRTAAEIAAGVTPTYYFFPPGDVRRYGADWTGVFSSSTAFEQAAASNKNVTVESGTYALSTAVSIALAQTTVAGTGAAIVETNNNVAFDVGADKFTIRGITHVSAHTGSGADAFVRAYDVNDVTVDSCRIGRGVINHRSTTAARVAGARVINCTFDGDYTGAVGSDFPNIIEFRGVEGVQVLGNRFSCSNFYRLVKASAATGGTAPYTLGTNRFIFANNVLDVSGSAIQQIIDLFAAAENVVVGDNVFKVGGTSVPLVMSIKPGASGDSSESEIANNISVTGNVFRLGSGVTAAILLDGAWGLSWGTNTYKCTIADNTLQTDTTSASAQISVKGMTDAVIEGNEIERPLVQFGRAISAGNNKRVAVRGNNIAAGSIEFVGNASTPGGESYGNQPESIMVCSNTVADVNTQGAISFFSITACDEITVADNHLRNETDTATVQGAVYFSTVSGVAYLNIHDNRANFADTAKNRVSGTPTVTQRTEHDNSWNVVVALWDPGSLPDGDGETKSVSVPGAAFGDWVRAAAPYDLQDCMVTAYVQASNTVEIRLQNESGGVRDLGSGDWRVSWGKS